MLCHMGCHVGWDYKVRSVPTSATKLDVSTMSPRPTRKNSAQATKCKHAFPPMRPPVDQRNGVKMWRNKLMIQPSFLGRNLIFKVPIAKSLTTMSPATMKSIIVTLFHLVRCPAQAHYHCQQRYSREAKDI